MRVLAIAAPSRLPGSKVPTAKEAGFDLTFANWRGVIGSPGMKANEREAWIQMLTRVRNSDRWKAILKKRDWNDTFQSGDEYAAYLKGEYERVGSLVQELGFVK
jgi:putative tricarboxylic transport membrane protein